MINNAPIRWASKIIVTAALLAAVFLPPISYAQRPTITDRLPFEVVANIVWHGQPLELRKVTSCDQRRRMHPGTEGDRELRLREVWEQSTFRLHHVLPSGEVLIFHLPGVCRAFDKRVVPPPAGFLPITILLDRSQTPRTAEQIVSYRYFRENGRRRFEFVNFRIERSDRESEAIDDDQRLTWLLESSGKPDAYFVSVSAAAIPKNVWSRYSALATELQRLKTGLVRRGLVEQHAKTLMLECEGGANGIGPSARCLTSQFDDRPFIVSAGQEAPGTWRLDISDVGVRRYARLLDASRIDSNGCEISFPTCNLFKGTYQLIVDGRPYELAKTMTDFVFDAERQLLIRPTYRVRRSTNVNTNRADQ